MIDEANRSLIESEFLLGRVEHTSENIRTIIQKTGYVVESLVSVLYNLFIRKELVHLGLGQMIQKMSNQIDEKFDHDIYVDLEFMARIRNNVVHPNRSDFSFEDASQFVGRARTFHDIFVRKRRSDLF